MARAEQVILSVVCVGCLAVPIGMLVFGALEPEEQVIVGGGKVTYTRIRDDLGVKAYAKRNTLPVVTRNGGKRPVEASANDIPTTVVEDRVHTDANEIPVGERRKKGFQPDFQPAE